MQLLIAKTHNMEFNMKIIIRIIGILLAIVKFSTASDLYTEDPYISNNILGEVNNISIDNLLDYKKISVAIEDEFDKARFHYIIAYEIDRRKKELDEKFNHQENKYKKAIMLLKQVNSLNNNHLYILLMQHTNLAYYLNPNHLIFY